jgi:expansin (peptidoglycan-binding protein)
VQNEALLVQVVDLCPECKPGDVDFSFPAYREITGTRTLRRPWAVPLPDRRPPLSPPRPLRCSAGLWPHRLRIDWEWASCAPEISGTIALAPKDGATPFWQAFYLANFRYPIKSAQLNGATLTRSPYQFFIHAAMQPPPGSVLELTADNGMKVSATLADITQAQDLGVQFPVGP